MYMGLLLFFIEVHTFTDKFGALNSRDLLGCLLFEKFSLNRSIGSTVVWIDSKNQPSLAIVPIELPVGPRADVVLAPHDLRILLVDTLPEFFLDN
jgi:hypothetical protein